MVDKIGDTHRAEMAAILARAFGQTVTPVGVDKDFSDVPNANDYWAAVTIHQAVKMNITSGYPDGTFRPNATATRAEAGTMIYNALHSEDGKDQLVILDLITKREAESLAALQKKDMNALQSITSSYSTGMLKLVSDSIASDSFLSKMISDGYEIQIEQKPTEVKIYNQDPQNPSSKPMIWKRFAVAEVTSEAKVTYKKGELNATVPIKIQGLEYWKRDADGSWKEYNSKVLDTGIIDGGVLNDMFKK